MPYGDAREREREITRMSDELTIQLQVLQESGARPRTRVEVEGVGGAAGPSLGGWVAGIGAGVDVEALAFLVLMQAAKSAQEDLKAIMAQVKAINAAKAHQRQAQQRMQEAAAAAARRDDEDDDDEEDDE